MKGADNDFRKEVYYYIWDANLKPSFENVPRDYWFEIDGRPVILFWNPNGFLQDSYLSELMKKDPAKYKSTTGLDETKSDAYNGKLSYILKCISDDFNSTFGVRPFLIIQREWTDRDFSLVNCPYLDGIHNWFAVPTMDMSEEVYNENLIYNTYISAYNFKGFSVGSGCPGFVQGDLARPNWQFIDADHGRYATKMMESFLAKNLISYFWKDLPTLPKTQPGGAVRIKSTTTIPTNASTCFASTATVLSRPDRNWKRKPATIVSTVRFRAIR